MFMRQQWRYAGRNGWNVLGWKIEAKILENIKHTMGCAVTHIPLSGLLLLLGLLLRFLLLLFAVCS